MLSKHVQCVVSSQVRENHVFVSSIHRKINSFSSTSYSLDVMNLFFLGKAYSLIGIFDTDLVVYVPTFSFKLANQMCNKKYFTKS